jgi:putative peptidoglycan lipid II flippase
MLKNILSVGGFTLLSRITGFLRDVVMAAVMGTGPVADAFVVAFRLPNHFRAIFGEGAFNSAFVPSYARLRERGRAAAAEIFANGLMTVMLAVQLVILVVAYVAMPWLVGLLAPGFEADPAKFDLAVTLTRITFPYLLFITLVTLVSGKLNAVDRFAAAAGAPVLLNLSLIAALAVAYLFPTAGHAAAVGVAVAGVLELALVLVAAERAGIGARFGRPRRDADMTVFLKALGPAIIGSAGVPIAVFADTILASLLPSGTVASMWYAERLYQLPVGVVGIAVGTVVLPTMSRKIAAGDVAGAHASQNRAMALTLALAAPFAVGFCLVPDLIMLALFRRGAFTRTDAAAAGAILAAYAVSIPATVLIRSAVASFFSRSDTTTPLIASLAAVAVNVALKIVLVRPLGGAGLALATAAGAWLNVFLLCVLAHRRDWMSFSPEFGRTVAAVVVASIALAFAILLLAPASVAITAHVSTWREGIQLALIAVVGGIVYGGVLLAMLRMLKVNLRRM